LFEALCSLADEGMSVIFVSHKLEEVEEICADVAVMRRGRVVGTSPMPCPSVDLIQMMFGKVLVEADPPAMEPADVVLRVDDVTLAERGVARVGLTASVRASEVIGLGGLEGSGQRTFLRACAGVLHPDRGRILLGERDMTGRGLEDFLATGVHYMPAGRLEE